MRSIAVIRVPNVGTLLTVDAADISSAHRPDTSKPALVFVDGLPQAFELVTVKQVHE